MSLATAEGVINESSHCLSMYSNARPQQGFFCTSMGKLQTA